MAKAKKYRKTQGVKLGQVRRGAQTQLKKLEAAIKSGKASAPAKAKQLVRELKRVIALADDNCPFKVMGDPLA